MILKTATTLTKWAECTHAVSEIENVQSNLLVHYKSKRTKDC